MDPLDRRVTEALRSWKLQLEAGINTGEALELAGRICTGEAHTAFAKASKLAGQGHDIRAIMDALAGIMPEGERATITAGWTAGRAEAAIGGVVEQRQLWYESRKRVLGKMLMPAGTLLIASVVWPLPGAVLGYYGLFGYLALAGMPLAIATGLAIFAAGFFRKRALERVSNDDGSPRAASAFDRTLLAIPLCGHIELQRSLAEFGSLLSNLINAGMPIAQALLLSARAMRNGCYRESVVRLSAETGMGHPFANAILAEPEMLWPREFTAAVAVGERSGTLDATLARLSVNARESYVRAIERLAEWTPRLLYGCVAVFVIVCIFVLAAGYMNMINEAMKGI